MQELSCPVLVLGAGISGLTLAYRLQQKGTPVLLADPSPRVGGSISTQVKEGFMWEEGPNSFTPTPALLNLIADLGLADQLVLAEGSLPRFVYWEGELLPVPMDPGALISSRLLTLGGKLRALRGVLGFVGAPPGSEETVEAFFSRHLGSQVVRRLVEPFVSGVYAGDSHQLSASGAFGRITDLETGYGSLLAGALQSPRPPKPTLSPLIQPPPQRGQLGNFRQGMEQLPRTLARQLGEAVHLGWIPKELLPSESGFKVTFATPQGKTCVQAHQVVLTMPAFAAAPLLQPLDAHVSDRLGEIPYPAVAVVALGYPVEAFPQPLSGFGHLLPRSQGLRTLGTIWTSCLFPHRAPQGYHCFLNFIGGATDPAYAFQTSSPLLTDLSPAERATLVHRELSQVLQAGPVDPIVVGERLWNRAIPQYTLGHRARIAEVQSRLARFKGLWLCANYLDGVSMGDCVQRAEQLAERIRA